MLVYSVLIGVSSITLFLNHRGRYRYAVIIQLIMLNVVIFYFSLFGSSLYQNHLFFMICCLGALAMFEFEERKRAYFFVVLSFLLFIISYFDPFFIVGKEYNAPAAINFLLTLFISVMVVVFIMKLYHHAERTAEKKNSQLLKVNHELDRFVYSASHELRAPLSSIMGLIELTGKSDDLDEIRSYLKHMRTSVENLDNVIKEIIDFSKNTNLVIKKEPVNLLRLVAEILESRRSTSIAGNIFIHNNIPPDTEIVTDDDRLKVVLRNLIDNSFSFHDETKEKRFVSIQAHRDTDFVKISIQDNGQGIAKEHLHRIYDMFYRANEKSRGAGLGLYVAKETLTRLGGKIELETEITIGSTFTVVLPSQA